jgi:hypothetical protein
MTDETPKNILRERFEELHENLVEELLARIENGSATHQDLSVAAKFLKDNKIEVSPASATKGKIKRLTDAMPFDAEDHEDTGT